MKLMLAATGLFESWNEDEPLVLIDLALVNVPIFSSDGFGPHFLSS